jgi:hypothetical protein
LFSGTDFGHNTERTAKRVYAGSNENSTAKSGGYILFYIFGMLLRETITHVEK